MHSTIGNRITPRGRRVSAALLVFCATAAMVGTAAAAPGGDVKRQVIVQYRPSELSDYTSAQALYRRIEDAARRACRGADLRAMQTFDLRRSCYQSAVDGAVVKIDATLLTEVHRNKSHGSPG